jgi:hypothetical protein
MFVVVTANMIIKPEGKRSHGRTRRRWENNTDQTD